MLALVLSIIALMSGRGALQPGVPVFIVPSYRSAVLARTAVSAKLARSVFLAKVCFEPRTPNLNEVRGPHSRSLVTSSWPKFSLSLLGPCVVAHEPAGPAVAGRSAVVKLCPVPGETWISLPVASTVPDQSGSEPPLGGSLRLLKL